MTASEHELTDVLATLTAVSEELARLAKGQEMSRSRMEEDLVKLRSQTVKQYLGSVTVLVMLIVASVGYIYSVESRFTLGFFDLQKDISLLSARAISNGEQIGSLNNRLAARSENAKANWLLHAQLHSDLESRIGQIGKVVGSK